MTGNESIVRAFRQLSSDCSRLDYDSFLLYDESLIPPPVLPDLPIHAFSLRDLVKMKFPMFAFGNRPPAIVPGNAELPLLHFYSANRGYDHYWLIEYDVRFTGDWCYFFGECSESPSDLLATHVMRFCDDEKWFWWQTLRFNKQPIDTDRLVSTFFPIYRLSGTACQLLVADYRKQWRGHFEVKLPTILNLNGCLIEDLGGEVSLFRRVTRTDSTSAKIPHWAWKQPFGGVRRCHLRGLAPIPSGIQ